VNTDTLQRKNNMRIYLAIAAKSNAVYNAYNEVRAFIAQDESRPVPMHIRNAPTKLMKNMDYGKGYQYSHSYDNNFSPQEYLPEKLAGTKFYDPGKNAREEELRKHLRMLWKEKYGY